MGNGPFRPAHIKKRLLAAATTLDSAVDEIDCDRFFRTGLHGDVDKLRRAAWELTTRDSMLDVVAALISFSSYLLGFEDSQNPKRRLRTKRFSQGVADQYFTLRKAIPGDVLGEAEKNWREFGGEGIVSESSMARFLAWFRDHYPDRYYDVF
jgi:hypothetical protein